MCNHPERALTPLYYYYDDDWGHKGNLVWSRSTPGIGGPIEECSLMLCTRCRAVVAIPNNKIHLDTDYMD